MATNSVIDQGSRKYISAVMDAPILEREHELKLARAWRDDKDEAALHELIEAYARFVIRIAWRFRGYGLPVGDLVQEGNIGLMEAAARFDPERENRFSTYASWWIMAAIQDYVLRHNSMVRVATTPVQRRLFFNLRRARAQMATRPDGELTGDEYDRMADEFGVKVTDIQRMEAHLGGRDASLNAAISQQQEGSGEQQDLLPDTGPSPEELAVDTVDGEIRTAWLYDALSELTPREQKIITHRFLEDDKQTLAEIGETFGVSKERVRQIEAKALAKLNSSIRRRVTDPATMELAVN